MPKPKLDKDSVKITITTNDRVDKFLESLINTGIFGKTKSQVAEQLIRRSMEEFLMTDKIEKLNKKL